MEQALARSLGNSCGGDCEDLCYLETAEADVWVRSRIQGVGLCPSREHVRRRPGLWGWTSEKQVQSQEQ